MASGRDARRRACVDKADAELDALAARDVRMGGNAFSEVLLIKGELNEAERAGGEPLTGADGSALRASLAALGYAPEDWEWLLAVGASGEPLDGPILREAICALDPATLVCCDEAAAAVVREAYADDLVVLPVLEEAMLAPGYVVRVCGLRVLNLGGFEAALGDPRQKQLMWARLKQVPPLGEPY